MPSVLKDYFEALERLKLGKSTRVPKGTRINKDSVSLEAGRKKGTIKKSRPIFVELIEAINVAAKAEIKSTDVMREQLALAKAEAAKYRMLWEEGLAREISLVKELCEVREALANEQHELFGKVTAITTIGQKILRR